MSTSTSASEAWVVYGTLVQATVVVAGALGIGAVRSRRSRRAGNVAPADFRGTVIFTVLAIIGLSVVGVIALNALWRHSWRGAGRAQRHNR